MLLGKKTKVSKKAKAIQSKIKQKTTTERTKSQAAVSATPKDSLEFQYIANENHYEKVIERIKSVKKVLWIGTAVYSPNNPIAKSPTSFPAERIA